MKRYKLWFWSILGFLGLFWAVWGYLAYPQPHGGAIAILDSLSDIYIDEDLDMGAYNITTEGKIIATTAGGETGMFQTGVAGYTVFAYSGGGWDIRAGNGNNQNQNVMRVDDSGNFDFYAGNITTTGTGRFDGGLTDSTPVVAIDLVNRQLENSSGTVVGDWENSILYDNSSVESINFNNRILTDENNAYSIDFTSNRFLADSSGNVGLNWANRQLLASDGTDVILDWSSAGTADFGDSDITTSGYIGLKSTAELRFYDNGNYVGFEAPALTGDQIWVLPTAVGAAGSALTDAAGDGTLSWVVPAGSGDFLADGTVDMTGNFNINTQAIEDANSNELITFVTGAAAVNNIQITNAAAGDGVKLTAVGSDTNIDLHLEPKGVGIIRLEETLPATAGQSLAEIIIDVDSSVQNSTSEYHAILVETTGTPSGELAAIGTVGKVDPIHQHVATFATPNQDEFAGKKEDGGTTWNDGDTPTIGEDLDGNEIFVADDDEIYFGSAAQFDEVEVIMGTGATKNVNVTFWYNTAADAWTQFFPDDGTDGFQQSGDIIWLLSGITGLWTGNGDPGVDDTTAGYWIKIIRTRVADPGTPTPTTIKIGLATTYSWDKTGAIDALSVEGDTLTEGGVAVLNTGEYDAGTDPTADLEEEVTEGSLADNTIIGADIKDDTVDSDDYAAGSIDAEHLAADIIDETKIADNGIDSEHYNDGSIDLAHMSSQSVDSDNIVDGTIVVADTAITAGRSLTWSTDDMVADDELYTDTKCIYWEDPVATDDFNSVWYAEKAVTITRLWCESDQIVNMTIQEDDGTPADIETTDLVCDATPADQTTGFEDAAIAAGSRIDCAVADVANTPTRCSFCWSFTYDD